MASRKRSVVWSFFEAEDEKKVLCLICLKTVLHFGHTTNMLRHLRTKHPSEFSDAETQRKPNASASKSINNNGEYVEVAVVMGEEQVEAGPVESESEMDGAIEGILRAATGVGGGPAGDGEGPAGEEDGSGGEASVATPGRKWSAVWAHYEKVEEEKKALCLLCMEKIQHQSSTSNLLRHLMKRHPTHYARLDTQTHARAGRKPTDTRAPRTHTYARATPSPHTPSHALPSPSNRLRAQTRNQSDLATYPGEGRVLERERELTEALRRVQQEEGRSLQQQRELLQQQRELERDRHAQREEQQAQRHALKEEREAHEAKLRREREELQRERAGLQQEREELQRLRRELEERQRVGLMSDNTGD